MEKELEGLQYDELVLDENVHKLTGKLKKIQGVNVGEVEIDEQATWLVTGLGYLNKNTPDEIIRESLKDTIIISKSQLIDFLNSKKDG